MALLPTSAQDLITRQPFVAQTGPSTKSQLVQALTGAITQGRADAGQRRQQQAFGAGAQALFSGTETQEQIADLFARDPERAKSLVEGAGAFTSQGQQKLADAAFSIQSMQNPQQRDAALQKISQEMQASGADPSVFASLIGQPANVQNSTLQGLQSAVLSVKQRADLAAGDRSFGLDERRTAAQERNIRSQIADRNKPTAATTAQRDFADLTKGLTPEQKAQARLIKLGLSPRAVGSAIQTISAQGLAEQIGDVEAIIKERAKFGELTGASRSKSIDKGFDTIRKIDRNVLNLDRAISAVEAGAGTGAIERRFPSIRAASIQLDQIQGELALDVIGAVTFGALSAGELDLAKQIALPTGLNGPQLIKHLQDRKSAQEKLRGYFNEQINFLDQGGSVAGFLREKERNGVVNTPPAQQASPGQAGTAQISPAPSGQPIKVGRFSIEVLN